jgi:PKD repeat protein/pimeloyl-ACP methyl ester carboxylesterase
MKKYCSKWIFLCSISTYLFLSTFFTEALAFETSYIISPKIVVYVVNHENVLIPSIADVPVGRIDIYDGTQTILRYYTALNYNQPLTILPAGLHDISVICNGVKLTQQITIDLGETKILTFVFDIPGEGIGVQQLRVPIASFTYSPHNPQANSDITFDGSSSGDPDGQIVNYFWNFEDNAILEGQIVTTSPEIGGVYDMTLIVTDNDGLTTPITKTITVANRPQQEPFASFNYFPDEPRTNERIYFDATSSFDPDGYIFEYSWNFGDGTYGRSPSATSDHTYTTDGHYTVQLTVTDNDGLSTTLERDISIGSSGNSGGDSGGGDDGSCNNFALIEIVDPVSDLLRELKITTDIDKLTTLGRVVQGVAADGVAQVVLRIKTCQASDRLRLTVISDQESESTSTNEDGGLMNLNHTSLENAQNEIFVDAQETNAGPMAFAVYRAPSDFSRCISKNNCLDDSKASREVKIQVTRTKQDGSPEIIEFPIKIVRPPVILLHGIWAKPNDDYWKDFYPLIGGKEGEKFAIYRVNYNRPIEGEIEDSQPSLPLLAKGAKVYESDLSFVENVATSLDQLNKNIDRFKNDWGVAAVQSDIVAHSMGGLVARMMARHHAYNNEHNFYQGYIHKLITIGTPHLGTHLAKELISPKNPCIRYWFGTKGMSAFESVKIQGKVYRGGVGDMQGNGDGQSMSDNLRLLLGSSPISTAFIAGSLELGQLQNVGKTLTANILKIECSESGDPLMERLEPDKWNESFPKMFSDGIVSVTSQLDGRTTSTEIFSGLHTEALTVLGFGLPAELLGREAPESQMPEEVIRLLNIPVYDDEAFTKLP